MPNIKIILLSFRLTRFKFFPADLSAVGVTFPFNCSEMIQSGKARAATLGKNKDRMTSPEVMLSFIHNIIVVTSPIGVQAPPALAAMTTTLPKIHLSCGLSSNFCKSIIITMAEVILSSTEDIKKVINPISQSNFFLLRVVIRLVMPSKPLCISMSSTIVMAPNK